MMTKRRFFSILLCLCLLCTGLPVTKVNAATNISVVNITIEEPAVGAKPATTATVPEDASYYVKEVTWGPASSKFEAEQAYQLKVLIAVKDGVDAQFVMKMANSAIDARVNGNQANWYHSNYQPGKELYVKYTFPAMEKAAAADTGDKKSSGAISSAADLMKMRDNPSGSYYLTKDITVSENTQIFNDLTYGGAAFSGTFDGKGHKIKGYTASVNASEFTYVSLFGKIKDATFKNLTLSGVNINVKSNYGAQVAALANGKAKCSKVTVTGKITVNGNETTSYDALEYDINGFCEIGTFTDCTNKANITANCRTSHFAGISVSGISGFGTFKNCKNAGTLSLTGYASSGEPFSVAGISVSGEHTGCSNAGTIKAKGMAGNTDYPIYAAGVSTQPMKISKCSNSGKVAVENLTDHDVYAGGVAGYYGVKEGEVCTRCFNTGTISIKQKGGKFFCGGLFGDLGGDGRELYNTGKVTVTASKAKDQNKDTGMVGGVAGYVNNLSECYNTGRISTNTKGKVGGVAGLSNSMDKWTVTHCYNTGKVSGKKGSLFVGGLLGSYDNPKASGYGSYFIRDNYSTTSPLYGRTQISWEPFWARGKKVSAITKKNCPKLTSKYWTYSGKHKRLILKNNKEK
ncbi:MAG: ZmpA/ZmpB/ZmpC family metallo-endopeptidase-related protein [Lachnospiraceae bacterium]